MLNLPMNITTNEMQGRKYCTIRKIVKIHVKFINICNLW